MFYEGVGRAMRPEVPVKGGKPGIKPMQYARSGCDICMIVGTRDGRYPQCILPRRKNHPCFPSRVGSYSFQLRSRYALAFTEPSASLGTLIVVVRSQAKARHNRFTSYQHRLLKVRLLNEGRISEPPCRLIVKNYDIAINAE